MNDADDKLRERIEKAVSEERIAIGVQAGHNPPRGVILFDQKVAMAVMRTIQGAVA
jgi:hypothetical protein